MLSDPELYQRCLRERVHLETCPTSSVLTGAVQVRPGRPHPILQFARDGANFSINSDDPMVTNTWVKDEYEVVRSWGMTELDIVRANVNAVKASFLPDPEKREMEKKLYRVYGIDVD